MAFVRKSITDVCWAVCWGMGSALLRLDNFGLLNYITSFVGIFTLILTFGIDSIVIRELVTNESKSNILLETAFTLKLIGAFLVIGIIAIAIFYTYNDSYINKLVLLLLVLLYFKVLM